MSIPKEPRQLMINLMYLVLTAMLALNVSAEIINAFFALDKGNKDSIVTMTAQTESTQSGLSSLLNEPSKAEFKPILPAIDKVRSLTKEFNGYVEELREELIDKTGNKNGKVDDGDYKEDHGAMKPIGKKNKDVTTRILVNGKKGEELKEKIISTRKEMIKVYTELLRQYGTTPFGLKASEVTDRIKSMETNLSLNVDDEEWTHSKDKKSWSDFKFRQMPLASVLPILSKMQSDASVSESAMVNDMATLAGGRTITFDAFFPVVNAKKSYVIKGEPFEAEISVGTYSSQISPSDINITVNGSSIPVGSDGKAKYSVGTSSTGKQTLNLTASVRNPLTGEVSKGTASYDYEVGVRSVSVSADKMNVFYIGVDNPISVAAAGVSSSSLKVSGSGGGISMSPKGNGKYNIRVSSPGEARVNVSGDGLNNTPFVFRVKPIPDPAAVLSGNKGGQMGSGEFKAQAGLIAMLENFDFDARCEIVGFELIYTPRRDDLKTSANPGGSFSSQSRALVNLAKPGDQYTFENVRGRCPGDGNATRKLNALAFRIR